MNAGRSCCFSPGTTALVQVTNFCNLACQHCFRDSPRDKASSVPVHRIVASIGHITAQAPVDRIVVSGGEPLLVPNLTHLLQSLGQVRGVPSLSLCTNATLVTPSVAAMLGDVGLRKATISLDGGQREHDLIRGSGTYERAIAGATSLSTNGIVVTVNLVLHAALVKPTRWVDSFADDVERLGARAITITSPIARRRVSDHVELFEFSSAEVSWVVDLLSSRLAGAAAIEVRIPLCRSGCPRDTRVLSIAPDGRVGACPDVGQPNVVQLRRGLRLPIVVRPNTC